jgi:hypothetical protein
MGIYSTDYLEFKMTRAVWLQRLGFEFDPFEYPVADRMGGDPNIDRYFVTFPYFEDLKKPCSTFLFTHRGCGKSANRIRLEHHCAEILDKPYILAVRYDNFLRVLADISLESHCEAILRRAVPTLFATLLRRFPGAVDHMSEREKEDLTWFVHIYSDRLTEAGLEQNLKDIGRLPPILTREKFWAAVKGGGSAVISLLKKVPDEAAAKALSTLADLLRREFRPAPYAGTMDPFEKLNRFAAITKCVGIDHVFVLVDRIDELEETLSEQKKVELLRPLVANIPLLDILCFKFFLPSELRPALRRQLGPDGFREDKLMIREANWREKDIAEILQTRLNAAVDKNRRIGKGPISFNHYLVEVQPGEKRWDVDHRLVKFAHCSPRDLVELGDRIFSEHTRRPTNQLQLSTDEVEEALRQFSKEWAQRLNGVDTLARLICIPQMPFTLEVAAQAFRLPEDQTEALLKNWRDKGLVKHLSRDPAQPEAALLFDIADPRARLVWKEEHL